MNKKEIMFSISWRVLGGLAKYGYNHDTLNRVISLVNAYNDTYPDYPIFMAIEYSDDSSSMRVYLEDDFVDLIF